MDWRVFLGFIFDTRSAFKGRFRSFSWNNSWLSCFNGWGIESRKQEDHEELKIFLQNCLISSRFDQNLSLQGERTSIYREIRAKLVGSWPMMRISLRVISAIWSRKISGIVAHDADSTSCDFSHPIAQNRWNRGPWRGFHSAWSSSKNPYEATCLSTVNRVRDLIATIRYHCTRHVGAT